jgi:Polyketide cyclase / dehydrase and lipid transport
MRGVTTITRMLRAPPEAVWARIAAVDRVHEWLPIVTHCRIEGSGPGARRVCETAHGAIVERVERIDHASRAFGYAVSEKPVFPLDDYPGTLHVTPCPGDRAAVTWTVEYQVAEEIREPVAPALHDVIAVGLEGLERLLRDRSRRCRRPNRAVLLGLLFSMGGASCLAPPATAQDRMIPRSQRLPCRSTWLRRRSGWPIAAGLRAPRHVQDAAAPAADRKTYGACARSSGRRPSRVGMRRSSAHSVILRLPCRFSPLGFL